MKKFNYSLNKMAFTEKCFILKIVQRDKEMVT